MIFDILQYSKRSKITHKMIQDHDLIELLFDRRGNDEEDGDVLLPIEAAAKHGHLEAVLELLRLGPHWGVLSPDFTAHDDNDTKLE